MTDLLLEVKNLSMHYDTLDGNVDSVKDISFSVKSGESFGLFGASPPIKNKNIFALVPPSGPVDPHKYGFNPISLEEGMDLIKPEYVYKKVKKFI